MSSIGSNIKALRALCGMTQDALAQRINVNRATIANWEIGRTSPDHGVIRDMADIFNVTTDWLIGRAEYEVAAGEDNPKVLEEISTINDNEVLIELWSRRESLQDLLMYADQLSDESIRKLVEVVKLMKNT